MQSTETEPQKRSEARRRLQHREPLMRKEGGARKSWILIDCPRGSKYSKNRSLLVYLEASEQIISKYLEPEGVV